MTLHGYGMTHSVKNDGDHGDDLTSEPWSHGLYTIIDGVQKVYVALQVSCHHHTLVALYSDDGQR